MIMTKLDTSGSTICVNTKGLVRVDDIVVFAVVVRDSALWLRFCDRNRQRARIRGSRCVEVPLDVVLACLMRESEKRCRE